MLARWQIFDRMSVKLNVARYSWNTFNSLTITYYNLFVNGTFVFYCLISAFHFEKKGMAILLQLLVLQEQRAPRSSSYPTQLSIKTVKNKNLVKLAKRKCYLSITVQTLIRRSRDEFIFNSLFLDQSFLHRYVIGAE